MCAIRTMVSETLADLGRVHRTQVLYPRAHTLLVHHAEPFAHQRHVRCRFFSYARQGTREKTPVCLPPVLQRTIPLSFLVGEPGVYRVVRPYLDLRSFDDAQGIAVSVQDAGLRDRKSTRLNSSHANISYAV